MQRLVLLCVWMWLGVLLYGQSSDLEKALSAAGENRPELEKVLQHYKKNESDSLKWKAACFLIENMPPHYTYVGTAVDTFYSAMGKVFKNPKNLGREYYNAKYDSVLNVLALELEQAQIRLDIKSMKADYLIRNIDQAFQMWQTPWGKQLPFDLFCEYVLPYRAGTESLSDWRTLFINRKPSELDLLKSVPNTTLLYGMCNSLNQKFVANLYFPFCFMPEFPLTALYDLKCGSCRDYSNQGLAQMRALGIPAALDFVPQWGRRSMGHEWNVLVVKEGMAIPFATNDGLGNHLYNYFEEVFPKVYRKTYQRQKGSLYYLSGDEPLPSLFDTPCLKDVTKEYLEVQDLEVNLQKVPANTKFAYLAVFDNRQWQIVQWGQVSDNKVLFKEMGQECVYLPVQYSENTAPIPLGWPLLCSSRGNVELIPNFAKKQSLRLTRKFRYSRNLERCANYVKGGKFQVANKPDFSDSLTVYTIRELPECRYQHVKLQYKGNYKYFRFLAPAESKCNISEIELYDEKGNKLPADSVISVDGGDRGHEDRKAFDGDVLTYYNAQWHPNNGWVGLKFNDPLHVASLYYLPRNDDNFIREGEEYELFYWGKDGWQSLGRQTGVKESLLEYKDAPTNALFLLHNHTKGKEERIFTYENGKQIWW